MKRIVMRFKKKLVLFLCVSMVMSIMTPAVVAIGNKELSSNLSQRQKLVMDVLDDDDANTTSITTIRELFVKALKSIDGDNGPRQSVKRILLKANMVKSFKNLNPNVKKDVENLLYDYAGNSSLTTDGRKVIKEAFSDVIVTDEIRDYTNLHRSKFRAIDLLMGRSIINRASDERGTMVVLSLLEFLTEKTGNPVAYDLKSNNKKIDLRLDVSNNSDLKIPLDWMISGLYMHKGSMETLLNHLETNINFGSTTEIAKFKKYLKDYRSDLEIYKSK